MSKGKENMNYENFLPGKQKNQYITLLQADRGFAAVAFFWRAEGGVLKKRVLRPVGYEFPRRKKSSASLQYCKY